MDVHVTVSKPRPRTSAPTCATHNYDSCIIVSFYNNNAYFYSVKCQEISEGQPNFTILGSTVEQMSTEAA